MVMNDELFCGMIDKRKALNLISRGTIVRDSHHRILTIRDSHHQDVNLRRVQALWKEVI